RPRTSCRSRSRRSRISPGPSEGAGCPLPADHAAGGAGTRACARTFSAKGDTPWPTRKGNLAPPTTRRITCAIRAAVPTIRSATRRFPTRRNPRRTSGRSPAARCRVSRFRPAPASFLQVSSARKGPYGRKSGRREQRCPRAADDVPTDGKEALRRREETAEEEKAEADRRE